MNDATGDPELPPPPDPRLALVTAAIHMTRHPRHPHYCRCDEFARAALTALAPEDGGAEDE